MIRKTAKDIGHGTYVIEPEYGPPPFAAGVPLAAKRGYGAGDRVAHKRQSGQTGTIRALEGDRLRVDWDGGSSDLYCTADLRLL